MFIPRTKNKLIGLMIFSPLFVPMITRFAEHRERPIEVATLETAYDVISADQRLNSIEGSSTSKTCQMV